MRILASLFTISLSDPRLGSNRHAELFSPSRPRRHDRFHGFFCDRQMFTDNLVVHREYDWIAAFLQCKHPTPFGGCPVATNRTAPHKHPPSNLSLASLIAICLLCHREMARVAVTASS